MRIDERSLDQLLPPDDVARVVWEYVCGLDLSPLLSRIKSVEGHAGHPAIDPRILLGLWLLATVHGIGSARELERLTRSHIAFEWLCGEVSVNYHTLSDFRSDNEAILDHMLTESVAALMHQGLVDLTEVAQDGMRVRANAGSHSFHRKETLDEYLVQAKAQVQALKTQADEDDAAVSRRQQAARERAARERQERVSEALKQRQQLAAERERAADAKRAAKEPRASTTDPESRLMKMPDGGFRPAYNVQLSTTTKDGIIVGVDVGNVGTDSGQLLPMHKQMVKRYNRAPKRMLGDGDFGKLTDIERLHKDHEVSVYIPLKCLERMVANGDDPYQPRPKDTPGVAAWRLRMGTDEAKTIYKRRGQTAEWVNARFRNWGLGQFLVRGLKQVRAVTLLFALTHNLVQSHLLRRRLKAA
jgi:transposase